MKYTSPHRLAQLEKAKSYYSREGYTVTEEHMMHYWDLTCKNSWFTVLVQLFTTQKRMEEFEKMRKMPSTLFEVVKYHEDQEDDVPANRITYPG